MDDIIHLATLRDGWNTILCWGVFSNLNNNHPRIEYLDFVGLGSEVFEQKEKKSVAWLLPLRNASSLRANRAADLGRVT